jgi:hypothetical protein
MRPQRIIVPHPQEGQASGIGLLAGLCPEQGYIPKFALPPADLLQHIPKRIIAPSQQYRRTRINHLAHAAQPIRQGVVPGISTVLSQAGQIMRILPTGGFDQYLGQTYWVEGVVRSHPGHDLGQPVAIAVVGKLGCYAGVDNRSKPVGGVVCKK